MTSTEALALRKRLRLTQQAFWGTYGPKKQAERVYRRLRG